MRTLFKLAVVLVLLGAATLSAIVVTDPELIPLEVESIWLIVGGLLGLAVLAMVGLIATRSSDRARKTIVIDALPYAQEPAFAAPSSPRHPSHPLGAPPELPPGYMPAPPRVATPPPPYYPAPLADDGPTTADPRAQAAAEEHYAQHRRRMARGSDEDLEGVTQRGVPPAAIRANTLQARPRGWEPAKTPSLTGRSRSSK